MTSRNLFFKLIREDLKRRIWAVCLAFLSFFFWMPVAAAMGISEINRQVERWIISETVFYGGITIETEKMNRLMSLTESIIGMGNIMIPLIVGMAAIILGLTGFSWLHSKKKVDFYHSIPVRRELLFAVKYLDGILIVFTMYLLNLFIACGILAVNGVGLGSSLLPGFIAMLVHLVSFILMYTVTLTAVIMTGNFFISILGTIVFFSYIPLFTSLLMGLSFLFFETANYSDSFWTDIMIHGSPVSYYAMLLGEGNSLNLNQYIQMVPKLGFPFMVAVVLMFFCLILYRLRPSEAAGRSMAFKLTKAPIKILLVVPFTIAMGLFFWEIYYSMGWAAFGFLFGLVLTHCIVEIIYHFDFRKLFSHPVHMGICAVLALAVIGSYRFDLFGYDRYIPAQNRLQSAAMDFGNLNDWMEYGIPKTEDGRSTRWVYLYSSKYVAENMRVTDYQAVRAIAEAGVANAKADKEKKFQYDQGWYEEDESDENVYWTSVDMTYRLNSGRTVSRRYYVNVIQLRDTFDQIYSTEEYKKGTYPIMSYEESNVTGVYLLKNYKIQEVKADETLRSQILAAYKEELTSLTLSERAQETPVVALRFLTIAERDYISEITRQRHPEFSGEFKLEEMQRVNFFPVYPSFEKTIDLLSKAGIDVNRKPELDDIERIELNGQYLRNRNMKSDDSYDYDSYSYDSYTGSTYENTTREMEIQKHVIKNDTEEHRRQIEEILEAVADQDLTHMNGLQKYDSGVKVQIYLKSVNDGLEEDQEEYSDYLFQGDKMPDFVKNLIDYDNLSNKDINYGLEGSED